MDDTPFIVTDDELKSIHKIDRELYSRLVLALNRAPIESMQAMALWLWLEQLGFPNIIQRMLSLTDQVVEEIAEEASRVMICLPSNILPASTNTNIPVTQNLMRRPISLKFIHDNREFAMLGTSKIINEVFLRVFNDIIQEARARAANESVPLGNVSGGSGPGSSSRGGGGSDHDQQGPGSSSTGLSPPAQRLN